MSHEQKFYDLIKEGKLSDAMSVIKESLTAMAGEAVVEQKYEIANEFGLKRVEEKEEMDDEKDDSEDDNSEEESDGEEEDEDEEKDEE